MKNKQTDTETVVVNSTQTYTNEDNGREITTEFPTVKEEESIAKTKKNGIFRHEKKKRSAEETVVLSTPEEEVRVYQTGSNASVQEDINDTRELISESPTQPIPTLEKTQVLEMDDHSEEHGEKDAQLLLEGFEEEHTDNDEPSEEERLQRVRREKIQDFSQKREMHMWEDAAQSEEYADQRGEVVYPETSLADEAAEEAAELPRERPEAIIEKLGSDVRKLHVSLFFSAVIEVILFLLTLFSMFSPVLAMGPVTYLIIHLVLLVLLAGINAPLLSDGFSRLFSRTPTIGSGVALSVLVSTIHTAVQLLNTTGVADGSTPLMTSIAGLGIFLLLLAKCLEKGRQYRNVGWVLNESEEKTVYKRINDPSLAEEIGRPALAIGEPQVAYYRKTATIHGYTEISDDTLVCTPQMKWYLPTVFSVSLLISLVYFAINGLTSWIVTVTLFCAMITVSAPALLLFALQLAHAGAAHTAEKEGVTITGYQAVENFGSVHALALDAMDIFPEQSVLLHGIKTFSGTRIDDAILDAASVSVRAGGPLSHVFRRMIQNKVDMLREVDTLVYEQDMGLSGWVNGRRVLIGNRKLLDNHGIDIPSKDYEQRYAKNGRQLVYLSIAGELSAMFVVSYVADPKIKDVLTTLTKNRITLLVRTCDQNITERLIATVFDLNGFYVELLNAPAGRSFEGLVDGVSQSEKSGMISDGRKEGLIFALAMCRRLKTGIRLFSVLQALIAAVGIALIGYTAVFQGLIFPPLYTIEILFGAALLFAASSVFFGKK